MCTISESDQERPDNGRREAHSDAEWTKLAHCYFFGKTVKDQRFANASITALIEKMQEIDRYPTGLASEVYQFTSKCDGLRQLIIDVHVWKGLGSWVKAPHDDATALVEFLQDVIKALAAEGANIQDPDAEMPWHVKCAYDVHGSAEVCEG